MSKHDILRRAIRVATSLKRDTVVVGISDLSAVLREHDELKNALTMFLAATHGRGQDGKQAIALAADAARAAIAKATGE